MTKFDITQWSDFVRGLTDAETEEAMRGALEKGQGEDARTVNLLRQVAEVGRLDHEFKIPDHALRGAKAIGSLQRPESAQEPSSSWLRFLPFSVSYDSLLQPAAVGTRNLHTLDRQMVFDTEDYTVEVRLEQENEPSSTVLVGEILEKTDTVRPVPQVPVLIKASGQIVAQSTTGPFGEFQAEGLPTDPLTLALLVNETECIQLPLHSE